VTRKRNLLLVFCGISGSIAVALGAAGAHALKNFLQPEQLESFNTAVLYHLLHNMVLLVLALFVTMDKYIRISSFFFIAGIIIFSGSIYLLSLRELLGAPWLKILGPVTPLGGLALIGGWICLTVAGFKEKQKV
jgi:uncharacterized membrane protein YgdD (TMEM256/DUF423 family)